MGLLVIYMIGQGLLVEPGIPVVVTDAVLSQEGQVNETESEITQVHWGYDPQG